MRLREEKLVEVALELRDSGRAGESAAKRNADLVADLRTKLDAAGAQAKVSLYPVFFFSSCHSELFLRASSNTYHLTLTCFRQMKRMKRSSKSQSRKTKGEGERQRQSWRPVNGKSKMERQRVR